MNTETGASWQREFYAGASVWTVLDSQGDVGNLYESVEAAQCELNYRVKNRGRGAATRIARLYIHTLKLAQERWEE